MGYFDDIVDDGSVMYHELCMHVCVCCIHTFSLLHMHQIHCVNFQYGYLVALK